ncbi:hypothetical protein IFM89_001838 [Coptis chinensis]|uniref:Late embryogenesis abundant protein n=1 Tax=Coptis chinensis TaxID=261450 RepID=A0A835HKC2_9MAGN|nr:hypothetical protein IFM89_001838 [Coptis chinensis]
MQFSILRQRLRQSAIPISSFLSKKSISNSIPSQKFTFTNYHSFTSIPKPHFQSFRKFSGEPDHSKEIDEINLKFAEAREEIESAMESKETVYFDEESEMARSAVKEVLDLFNGLLEKLSEKEKGVVQRAMGLKIEQLKAELAQLDE